MLSFFVFLIVGVPVAPEQWTAQITGFSYSDEVGAQYAALWAFDAIGGREYISGVIFLIKIYYYLNESLTLLELYSKRWRAA